VIRMEDWVLVGGLVGVSVLITYFLSTIYFAQRVYEIRREHVEENQALNTEIIDLRQRARRNEIRDRTMGSVPVSRLIGDDNG